ncbi:MAG: uroporphyrinogen-III C-methyltransferase, partial [Chloroflexota bacterium]
TRAECIFVGKEADHRLLDQAEINRILIDRARAGKTVARLKGGDPFVFGRGGEEAEALAEAGLGFEVVPGVTSAVAVPAYAGIPLTHRLISSGFTVVTGHEDPDKPESRLDWEQLARGTATLVFLMGLANLDKIARRLIENGRPPSTPAAVISRGTRPDQQTVLASLADVAERARDPRLDPPAIIVVGEVAGLRERLAWFDNRPLFGKRVLITRTREQVGTLAKLLTERGAIPIELPTIRTEPPVDWAPVDRAIQQLDRYAWAIFTSVNGVRYFFGRLEHHGLDPRALKGVRLGAIGPATAGALAEWRLRADFSPSDYVAEAIVEGMKQFDLAGQQVLLPRAQDVREALAVGLASQGARVDDVAVYQTLPAGDTTYAQRLFDENQVDLVTFTSSSTARNLVRLLGDRAQDLLARVVVAGIGPITCQTARDLGLTVRVEATEHSIPGLVAAVERYLAARDRE